jgi:hypothetical protein
MKGLNHSRKIHTPIPESELELACGQFSKSKRVNSKQTIFMSAVRLL